MVMVAAAAPARNVRRPTPLVLIGLLLLVLQTVPLPPWLLARLAPATAALLPQWSGAAETPGLFGYWSCISFTPAETLSTAAPKKWQCTSPARRNMPYLK